MEVKWLEDRTGQRNLCLQFGVYYFSGLESMMVEQRNSREPVPHDTVLLTRPHVSILPKMFLQMGTIQTWASGTILIQTTTSGIIEAKFLSWTRCHRPTHVVINQHGTFSKVLVPVFPSRHLWGHPHTKEDSAKFKDIDANNRQFILCCDMRTRGI